MIVTYINNSAILYEHNMDQLFKQLGAGGSGGSNPFGNL